METIFTISTVIAGMMSNTTIMGKMADLSIRTICFSFATASGLCWTSRELQNLFLEAGKSAENCIPQLALCCGALLEGLVLWQFLSRARRFSEHTVLRDRISAGLLLLGCLSWVALYEMSLFQFPAFDPIYALLPAFCYAAALMILLSHCTDIAPQEESADNTMLRLMQEIMELRKESARLLRQMERFERVNSGKRLSINTRRRICRHRRKRQK